MKGTFFKNPIELNVLIDGEAWTQGNSITGSLQVKHHQGNMELSANVGCHLCICNKKKIKDKDDSGIKVINSITLEEGEDVLDFDFKLKADCPISDSTNNYFLIYGDIDNPFESAGLLELTVSPCQEIMSFVEIFEQFFRFKFKKFKNKKGLIEAVINPPQTNEWATVQKLSVLMRMNTTTLEMNFNCALKKISYDSSLSKTKDEKKEIKISMTKKEYERYGSVNQDEIRKVIASVLEQIRLKPII